MKNARAFGRLHEQLLFVHADPRLRSRGLTGEQHLAARTADSEGKVDAAEMPRAERLADNQQVFLQRGRVQIFSSQRITTGSRAVPGITLISRRTSR